MRFSLLLILISHFFCNWAAASVYETESNAVSVVPKIYFYQDSLDLLSFDKIQSASFADEFKRTKTARLNFGYSKATFWIKTVAKTSLNREWLFEIGYPTLDKIEFYAKNEVGNWEKTITGDAFPFNERSINHKNFVFPINLSPSTSQEFYIKVKSSGSVILPIHIVEKAHFTILSERNNLLYGILYGIILIMVIYNLFLYLSIRDKNYLLYVIAISGSMVFFFTKNGHNYQLIIDESPRLNAFLIVFPLAWWMTASYFFAISFLRVQKYNSLLYKILKTLSFSGFALIAFSIAGDYNIVIKVEALFSFVMIVTLIITGIVVWTKGYKAARFFVYGWGAYLLGVLVYLLNSAGVLPNTIFTSYAMEIGSLFEITLLSLALADKFQHLKKQTDKAQLKMLKAQQELIEMQKNTNEELEKKVSERTFKIIEQKEKVAFISQSLEEKSKNLTDNILYARNSQNAFLPTSEEISTLFPKHFILFRPKDIVSGDFYWVAKSGNKTIVAVADCTGHGVPGAFMSMLGSSILNRIVKEQNIVSPLAILKKLNTEMIAILEKRDVDNIDGMDICICALEQHQKEVLLHYSGAKIALFIYEKSFPKQLKTIKASRKSIAGMQNLQAFEEHKMRLSQGDIIYIATDGLINQANEARKKIGLPKFKETLSNIGFQTMLEQKQVLESLLASHQKEEFQRDDITVLGIRV